MDWTESNEASMGVDVGYSGECKRCGTSVHQLAADRPRMTAIWLRCPRCLRADSEHVADGGEAEFWSAPHPCSVCQAARERWDASRCPRCGDGNAGRYMWMPD